MSRLLTFVLLATALRPAMATEKPFAFGSVRFEENRGQADASVCYLARARGQQVFLTDDGVLFAPPRGAAVHMKFGGAGRSHWAPGGPASDSISYYLGNDPAKWVKAAPVFDRVIWRDVYPGMDVAFHGSGDHLEYDLVLAPGADPSRMRIQFDASARVRVAADGTVRISSGGSVIRQRAPDIWQEASSGKRRKIAGRFVAAGKNELRLALSSYARSKALVVDPVLEMATYLGGENDDDVVAIADGAVAGNTRSVAFPANNPTLRGGRDVFIRGTGPAIPNQPTRNTFSGTIVIGGSGDDELAGIAFTSFVNSGFYLAGTTTSKDFPVTGTSQYLGGASDGFVVFVGVSQGYAFLASGFYVGGSGEDRITCFAGDGTITAFAGVTDSPDLPTTDVPQKVLTGGKDAFYGILTPFVGPPAAYGYLGGSGDDAAYAVAVRSSASVWIGGETRSSDFPFAGGALSGPSDAFLTEVSTTGSFSFNFPTATATVTSYRIGGSGEDSIRALVATPSTLIGSNGFSQLLRTFTIDGIGFAGVTTSTDLPVRNAAQPQPGGDRDGFAGIWDRTAAAPRWLTYVGGSGPDEATAIAQNWAGDLYVGGWTGSKDLPVVQALQPATAGGEDGLFAVFTYDGGLQQLTYFGGSGDDRIRAVGVTFSSAGRVAGSTTSADLPQHLPWQDRGGRSDGFVADIGSDYFLGPTELILAKDGLNSLVVRTGRTSFREPVTYRSADPSRVRLVYLGRSFDQLTAAPEDNIAVEGLDDHGEVEVIVSAPGYSSKTIRVKLYPGAFIPFVNTGANSISTWSSPSYVYASYYSIDPATGKPVGATAGLRGGAPPAVFNWSLSDPTVFDLIPGDGVTQLRALKAGSAVLTLSVPGYAVLQADLTVTAAAPRPVPPANDFHLGRDLVANLPISFGINGNFVGSGFRGTLSARSGDPSRLLLSVAPDQPGRDHVSLSLTSSLSAIYAQALADDGPVQVFLTSSEFEGEIPITVILEPAVLRWGSIRTGPSGQAFDPTVSLNTSAQATALPISLQSQSGTIGDLRPGVPPLTLKLSNSNPRVVELNRLTLVLGTFNTRYSLLGLAPGSSELSLTSSNDHIQPVPATVHVDVQTFVPTLPTLTYSSYVGSGLQTPVTFQYYSATASVTVLSDDPSAVLVSSSATARGSDHAVVQFNSGQYTFYLQGLKSTGATTVRVRFPEGERAFPVILLPSGVGFAPNPTSTFVQGFDMAARVAAFALDRDSGIGVFQQIPQPGPGITVRFRSDGAPVRRDRDSAVLTADAPQATLDFTLPPAGQQATLFVDTDGNSSVSPLTSTLKVGSTASSDTVTLANLILARGELRQYNFPGGASPAVAITSSDPQNILVSTTATGPPAPSIQLPKGTSSFYIHALGDLGVVTLRLDSPGATASEIKVALQPLQLNVYSASVPLGGSVDFSASLNANTLRPGVGPIHFTARIANPSVATVSPGAFDAGGANSTSYIMLRVTGVSPGTTQLIIEGPPDVYIVPIAIAITVPTAPTQTALPSYTLGRNLQGDTQIDLGAGFTNPNGAIVTLTSSDPGLLLLSRSASTPGTASVVVAVPAGDRRTQLIYLQAIGEGNATIQMTASGSTLPVAMVHIAPSWVSCGAQPISMAAGSTQTLSCTARYDFGPFPQLQDIVARAGLADVTVRLASTAPDVFTVSPPTFSLQSGGIQVTLRAVAPGSGVLQATPPSTFGPSPDGSETVSVTVVRPPLTSSCNEMVLGKDTQLTCLIPSAAGTVTATSQDPNLLLVSNDANLAGGPSVTAVPNGGGVSVTLQGLGGYGTAEVVFSAAGYQDLRVAVALRPVEIVLSGPSQSLPISLRVGETTTMSVGMRMSINYVTPRAGANIGIVLSADQPGIVSLSPTHLVFNGPQSSGEVRIQAMAAGSTLVRMAVPAGFLATGTPMAVSVTSQ